jgi:DNA-binding CsgD family transcriptional regulator/tetratricopeptide (TPR) repeat protein
MALSVTRPVVCPVLVGRDREVAWLQQELFEAAAGPGRTALISGEAGIGKSRLIDELEAPAAELGFLKLRGACFESDASFPFAPVIDLVRSFLASPPLTESAIDDREQLAEVAPLLTGSTERTPKVAALPADPEQARRHIVDALTGFVVKQSARQPVLFVIEDIHWSDEATLELTLNLARRAPEHPILTLLSYRAEDLNAAQAHFLAELERRRLASELALHPLDAADVGAMVAAILARGASVPPPFVEAVHSVAEGNPYVVEELLKSLAAQEPTPSGSADYEVWREHLTVPRSIQDWVLRRLVSVSGPAQRILTLAAVAGRRFEFELLLNLSGHDEPALLELLRELVTAQLFVEEADDRFAFRHALTRQAVYERLLSHERRGLHHRIAEALEQQAAGLDGAHQADLAYHWYAAESWERALAYARRMGERARAIHAPQAAVEHFSHAIEATEKLGRAVPCDLYRSRGQAYEVQGQLDRAFGDLERALSAAREVGDGDAEWQAQLDLGFLSMSRDLGQAGDRFSQALAVAERLGDQRKRAYSLNRLGNCLANKRQPERAQGLYEEALTVFQELDDRLGQGETLDLLSLATYLRGDRLGALGCLEKAARHFRELGERQRLASVLITSSQLRSPSRVFDVLPGARCVKAAALGEAEEALVIAREIGWRAGESWALAELAGCLAGDGEYGRALSSAHRAAAIAEDIEHQHLMAVTHGTLGAIHGDLLMADEALEHCARAYALGRETGSDHVSGLAARFLASAYILNRNLTQAEQLLRENVRAEAAVDTLIEAGLLAVYAELRLAQRDPEQALSIADRLAVWAGSNGGREVVPQLARLRGEALLALGSRSEAEASLRSARDAAEQQHARPALWRLDTALGKVLYAGGHRAEAERAYARARVTVTELGETIPEEDIRAEFLRRALKLVPGATLPSTLRSAKAMHGGLTARERQVAAFIAQGLTNAQIAMAWVVSERTVETHTGHIRDKLGFTARTQIAGWAVEHGLDAPP